MSAAVESYLSYLLFVHLWLTNVTFIQTTFHKKKKKKDLKTYYSSKGG